MSTLRDKLIRLAYTNPGPVQDALLPLLREAADNLKVTVHKSGGGDSITFKVEGKVGKVEVHGETTRCTPSTLIPGHKMPHESDIAKEANDIAPEGKFHRGTFADPEGKGVKLTSAMIGAIRKAIAKSLTAILKEKTKDYERR